MTSGSGLAAHFRRPGAREQQESHPRAAFLFAFSNALEEAGA